MKMAWPTESGAKELLVGKVIACNIKSRASCINLKISQNSNVS